MNIYAYASESITDNFDDGSPFRTELEDLTGSLTRVIANNADMKPLLVRMGSIISARIGITVKVVNTNSKSAAILPVVPSLSHLAAEYNKPKQTIKQALVEIRKELPFISVDEQTLYITAPSDTSVVIGMDFLYAIKRHSISPEDMVTYLMVKIVETSRFFRLVENVVEKRRRLSEMLREGESINALHVRNELMELVQDPFIRNKLAKLKLDTPAQVKQNRGKLFELVISDSSIAVNPDKMLDDNLIIVEVMAKADNSDLEYMEDYIKGGVVNTYIAVVKSVFFGMAIAVLVLSLMAMSGTVLLLGAVVVVAYIPTVLLLSALGVFVVWIVPKIINVVIRGINFMSGRGVMDPKTRIKIIDNSKGLVASLARSKDLTRTELTALRKVVHETNLVEKDITNKLANVKGLTSGELTSKIGSLVNNPLFMESAIAGNA